MYDGPQPVNPNVVDYRVPRTTDVPDRVTTILAERRDGIGPYGAKGAGEGALNPVGAAVTAAVARAIGRWPDRLPLTPERVSDADAGGAEPMTEPRTLEDLAFDARRAYQTVEDMVHHVVREGILGGIYKPGERLAQDRIAEIMGVSRIPVRAALRRLEAEGFVDFVAHKGADRPLAEPQGDRRDL